LQERAGKGALGLVDDSCFLRILAWHEACLADVLLARATGRPRLVEPPKPLDPHQAPSLHDPLRRDS